MEIPVDWTHMNSLSGAIVKKMKTRKAFEEL